MTRISAKELKKRTIHILDNKTHQLEEMYNTRTLIESVDYLVLAKYINSNNAGIIIDGIITSIIGFNFNTNNELFSCIINDDLITNKEITMNNINNYSNLIKNEDVKDKMYSLEEIWSKLHNKWLKELLYCYCSKKGEIQWKKLVRRVPTYT